MEQPQGAIEEIVVRLRAIQDTLERIEHLLTRHEKARHLEAEAMPVSNVPETASRTSAKLQRTGPQLLTVGEVAAILGQSVATIRKWGYLRQIEIVRLGRSVRISAAEVDRLIRTHRQSRRKS